ncbi:TIGR03086 family metal-binding protein [Nocardioides sp. GCM10027113]|uniref:TIGR03086 family metal-binding protein n=1 Tax=unclassified Nocardioides TaxID=2615069 RepID=UPI0036143158
MSTQTDTHQSVVLLSRALDQAGDVIAAVHEDQLDQPTPCADWDVGRLVSHLVADPRHFLEMARGGRPAWTGEPERVLYPAATFRSAGDDLIHHWHQQGDPEDPGAVDWQTAEFAVHTWDLATAVGYPVGQLDAEVAERALAFMTATLTAENRGDAFGPEQRPPHGADAYARLASYTGRTVS